MYIQQNASKKYIRTYIWQYYINFKIIKISFIYGKDNLVPLNDWQTIVFYNCFEKN